MSRSEPSRHPAGAPCRHGGVGRFRAFQGWPADAIQTVRDLGEVEIYSPGAVVVGSEIPGDRAVLVVLSGRLETAPTGRPGDRAESFHAGDVVGVVSFLDGRAEPSHVRSVEPSSVLRIRVGAIEALAAAQPELALRIVFEVGAVLAQRVRLAQAGSDALGRTGI